MFTGPLSGMPNAAASLDKTASRIAAPPTSSSAASIEQPPDRVALTAEMTSLIQSLSDFEASSQALEAEASRAESTLNITA